MSPDDLVIAALISYEVLAWGSQRVRWGPSLPLITSVLDAQPRPVRWAFVAGLLGTLVVHLELLPLG